jgi:hypothetical protein
MTTIPAVITTKRYDLARHAQWRAAELLVQQEAGQGDGDERVAYGDDRQDRRQQDALLERILVEHEAQRADDSDSVE